MPTYAPILTENDLPPAGPLNERARERSDLDFKSFADRSKMYEHAKDVAAFANALGGVIVVGAKIENDQLVYHGIKNQTATDVVEMYERAGKDCCSPAHYVNVVPIPLTGGRHVVAINVDPSIDAFIGSVTEHSPEEWVLPIRRGSQTERLTPGNLPMYMNAHVRWAIIMLEGIPKERRRAVKVYRNPSATDVPGTT